MQYKIGTNVNKFSVSSPLVWKTAKTFLGGLRMVDWAQLAGRKYNNNRSSWKQGLKSNAIEDGKWGEVAAYCVLTRLGLNISEPNFELYPVKGDGGKDLVAFSLCGYNLQIKTSSSKIGKMLVRGAKLVRGQGLRRVNIDPNSIFIHVSYDKVKRLYTLDGWCFGDFVLGFDLEAPYRGNDHLNYGVPLDLMEDMHSLVEILK